MEGKSDSPGDETHLISDVPTFVVFNRLLPTVQGVLVKKMEVFENTRFFHCPYLCPNMW
jgi:hypothetical protein